MLEVLNAFLVGTVHELRELLTHFERSAVRCDCFVNCLWLAFWPCNGCIEPVNTWLELCLINIRAPVPMKEFVCGSVAFLQHQCRREAM